MRKRSGASGGASIGLLVSAAIGSAASGLACSQTPLVPDDAGGTGAPPASGPRPLTTVPIDAVALAADDSGIYWTSPSNELWVLRAPGGVPARLAVGGPRGSSCCDVGLPPRPLLTTDHVLWFAADVTLHRTRKDGGGDDELARTAWGGSLASDGRNLYWTETLDPGRHYQLRTLPIGALPGTQPTVLVDADRDIESVAARDGRFYWAQITVSDWPVFESMLWSAPVDALAPPEAATAIAGSSRSFALAAAGAELLFLNQHDNWTVSLGRLAPSGEPQSVAVLQPYDSVRLVDVADGWLLATTMSRLDDSQTLRLLATPLTGGDPKIIAQGLRTAAIGAPAGIVYVDAAQGLVALPTAEINGMVGLAPYFADRLP